MLREHKNDHDSMCPALTCPEVEHRLWADICAYSMCCECEYIARIRQDERSKAAERMRDLQCEPSVFDGNRVVQRGEALMAVLNISGDE